MRVLWIKHGRYKIAAIFLAPQNQGRTSQACMGYSVNELGIAAEQFEPFLLLRVTHAFQRQYSSARVSHCYPARGPRPHGWAALLTPLYALLMGHNFANSVLGKLTLAKRVRTLWTLDAGDKVTRVKFSSPHAGLSASWFGGS